MNLFSVFCFILTYLFIFVTLCLMISHWTSRRDSGNRICVSDSSGSAGRVTAEVATCNIASIVVGVDFLFVDFVVVIVFCDV